MDTRLSEPFQQQGAIRRTYFPPGTNEKKIFKHYEARKPEILGAMEYLLNYFEFLSIGILQGKLDERILHKSLRGILCTLVFDMRKVIYNHRVEKGNKLAYENLVKVYFRWVIKKENNGEWKEGIDLGQNLSD